MTNEERAEWLRKCPDSYVILTRSDYQRMAYKKHLMLHMIGLGLEKLDIYLDAKKQVEWDNMHFDRFYAKHLIEKEMLKELKDE